MTSKRLSTLLFIVALVWGVGGLGWFASWSGGRPESAFGVGVAQADPSSWNQLITTNTVEGDPDAFANMPGGDPDAFAQPPSPTDSTSTVGTHPRVGSGSASPVLRVILGVSSAISGILGWS